MLDSVDDTEAVLLHFAGTPPSRRWPRSARPASQAEAEAMIAAGALLLGAVLVGWLAPVRSFPARRMRRAWRCPRQSPA